MEEDIKITASIDPSKTAICKFVIDRPVNRGGFAHFSDKSQANGSPLAEGIFGIPDVIELEIAENIVTIWKIDGVEWRPLAKKIAEVLRTHIRSGQPSVSPEKQSPVSADDEIRAKVQEIFDTQINPSLGSHGGFVDLIDVKDNKIYLRMGGGCHGCGQADATLKQGIEVSIREKIPNIADILDVTDHAAGTNPYYAPAPR